MNKKINVFLIMMIVAISLTIATDEPTIVEACDFSVDKCDWIETDDSVARFSALTLQEAYSNADLGDGMLMWNDNDTETLIVAEVDFNRGLAEYSEDNAYKITFDVFKNDGTGDFAVKIYDGETLVQTCKELVTSLVVDKTITCILDDESTYTDLTLQLELNDEDGESITGDVVVSNFAIQYGAKSWYTSQSIGELLSGILPAVVIIGLMKKLF